MNHDDKIREICEQLFCTQPWSGVISTEEAMSEIWHQRMELNETDRQLFDDQVSMGIHPVRAMEAVELISGRVPSRMHRERTTAPVAKAW
jgi:hypothetical protein